MALPENLSKIQSEILDDHVAHFKNNVYQSVKMLAPFMSEQDITLFFTSIISKIYE